MRRAWPIVVVVAAFGALGLSNALKPSAGRSETAVETQARLDRLPADVGPWTGTATQVPEKQLKVAEAQAHLSRVYARENPRASVNVLLLFGEPGPLGAHTPEVCYEGAGFRQVSPSARKAVPGEPAEFWTARFETGAYPPSVVQVTWGWGADGVWKASDNPRFDFADRRAIFKLYVSRVVPPGGRDDQDPTDDFLGPFLRTLRDGLARPATDAPAG